jgi:imidazole glycerol phosphate synthase subunit HisF
MSFRLVGCLLIKNSVCVQSFSFRGLVPLGMFSLALSFLSKLDPDEICIIDLDGDINNFIKDKGALEGCNLPIVIGGGALKNMPSSEHIFHERILINSELFENDSEILEGILKHNGRQSIIGYLPIKYDAGKFKVYCSTVRGFVSVNDGFWIKINETCSDIIVLDSEAQGSESGFNFNLMKKVEFPISRVYISGGIIHKDITKAKDNGYAGVVIDNKSLFTEVNFKCR